MPRQIGFGRFANMRIEHELNQIGTAPTKFLLCRHRLGQTNMQI
jgi:hypothetical protein